jgi:hypothetical protein
MFIESIVDDDQLLAEVRVSFFIGKCTEFECLRFNYYVRSAQGCAIACARLVFLFGRESFWTYLEYLTLHTPSGISRGMNSC